MLTLSVERVVGYIEACIKRGEYAAGSSLPAERDLSKQLKVSRATIRAATRELTARGLLRHEPHHRPVVQPGFLSGTRLSSPTNPRTVLFISFHDLSRPEQAAVYRGAGRALAQDGLRLAFSFIAYGGWERQREAVRDELFLATQDPNIAGIILWYNGNWEPILPSLHAFRATHRPLIFIDREPPPSLDGDFVGIDNRIAAAAVVQHLIDQGHTRIAHITYNESSSTVLQRAEGYRQALDENRIPYRPEWVYPIVYNDFGYNPTPESLIDSWRDAGSAGPTALFAVNDALAELFAQAARMSGLHVPEDIAVAGFDGVEEFSPRNAPPFLTTAAQPMERIGWEAGYLLRQRLAQPGEPRSFRHVLLNAPLLVRGSTVSVLETATSPKTEFLPNPNQRR